MAKPKKSISLLAMSQKEQACCWCYLVLELFFLPGFLNYVNQLLSHPVSVGWLNLVFFALNFGVLLVLCRDHLSKALICAGRHPLSLLKAVIVGFLAYLLLTGALTRLIQWAVPDFTNVNDGNITTLLSGDFWPMAIGTVLLVPMAEELLYRGLLFGSFHGKNPAVAYLLSTGVFCTIHIMGYVGKFDPLILLLCFVQYIPAGLTLGWAYASSGTILAPILIHTVINAMGIYTVR